MSGKRARIEDVVRLTGLSRSTIDRVLNGRPGVRTDTKERVERALQELGFAPNAMSARGAFQPKSVRILLAAGTNPFFEELRKGIEASAETRRIEGLKIHVKSFDPYQPASLIAALGDVPDETTSVVTIGIDMPEINAAINELVTRGIRVVTVVSDAPMSQRSAYVGQDNFVAGKTAARLMTEILDPGEGDVAVLIGHLQFRHLLDRLSGFTQVLGLRRPDLNVIQTKPYGTDPEQALRIIEGLKRNHPNLKGVYLSGGGQPLLIDALKNLGPSKPLIIGHEVTSASRKALAQGTFRLVVAHDVDELGRKSIDAALVDDIDGTVACSVNVYLTENLPPA